MNSFTFLHPWGFVALSALVVVGFIYLFYQRYRPQRISGLFLWGNPAPTHRGGRKLERLRFSRSLLLDILAALLLALAIAGPAITRNTGITHAIILDGSLSMQANDNDEKARTAALRIIGNLTGNEKTLVLLAADKPYILADADSQTNQTEEAIDNYEPYGDSDSLVSALHLARQLVSGSMQITVLTDHEFTTSPPPDTIVRIESFAARSGNVAILSLSRESAPDGDNLHLSIGNLDPEAQKVTLTLNSRKDEIYTNSFLLAPDGIRHLSLNPGTLPEDIIEVIISAPHDALEQDSHARILSEPQRTVRFNVNVTSKSIRNAAARALRAAGGFYDNDLYDLLITDNSETVDNAPVALLLPSADRKAESIYTGPFILDRMELLCTDMELSGLYWPYVPLASDAGESHTLVSAGEQPLLWRRGNHYSMAIDVASSNMLRSSTWPVLMANLVRISRAKLPGPMRTNYRLGEGLRYVSGEEETPVFLKTPTVRLPLPERLEAYNLPRQPGIYELQDPQEKTLYRIAINALSTSESDLRKLAPEDSVKTFGENANGNSPRTTTSLAALAALAAIMLLGLNWYLDRC